MSENNTFSEEILCRNRYKKLMSLFEDWSVQYNHLKEYSFLVLKLSSLELFNFLLDDKEAISQKIKLMISTQFREGFYWLFYNPVCREVF